MIPKIPSPDSSGSDPTRGAGQYLSRIGDLDFYVLDSLDAVRPFWTVLERHSRATPFQRFAWIEACWSVEAGQDGRRPLVVVGFEREEPKLILPFVLDTRSFCRRLMWLADGFNDYNAPVVAADLESNLAEETIASVIPILRSDSTPFDVVHLVRQPDGLPDTLGPAAGIRSVAAEHASHALPLQRDWPGLYASLRSAKSRRRLRGKFKALKAHGPTTFRRIRSVREQVVIANRVLDWKSEQLDRMGARNPFRRPLKQSSGGLREAITEAVSHEDGPLRIYALFVNQDPVAGLIGFAERSAFSLFVTAYQADRYGQASPGTFLLLKSMELSARAGLQSYDFLYGNEPYKTEWGGVPIPMRHSLAPYSVKGAAYCALTETQLAAKKWILARPEVFGFLKASNRRLTALQDAVHARAAALGLCDSLADNSGSAANISTGER